MIPYPSKIYPLGRQFIDLSDELVVAVLRTIDAGWKLALTKPEVNINADEVTITECLRDAMRSALVMSNFPWQHNMVILPGTESRSKAEMTCPDGILDIPLFFCHIHLESGEHDPHAIIECKRVCEGDTRLAREYVVSGIDRFKSEKYAENHSKGFMIGYSLTNDPQKIVVGINQYLNRKSRDNEKLESKYLNEVNRMGWLSKHIRRDNKKTIIIHHTILVMISAN